MTHEDFNEALIFLQEALASTNRNQAAALLTVAVLSRVVSNPGTTLSELAKQTNKPHPSYLSHVLETLALGKLITRKRQGGAVRLTATATGIRIITSALQILGMSPNVKLPAKP